MCACFSSSSTDCDCCEHYLCGVGSLYGASYQSMPTPRSMDLDVRPVGVFTSGSSLATSGFILARE